MSINEAALYDEHEAALGSPNDPIWSNDQLEQLISALSDFKKKRDKVQRKLKIYETSINVIEQEINKLLPTSQN